METNRNPDGLISARARAVPTRPVPAVEEQHPAGTSNPPLRSGEVLPAIRSAPEARDALSAEDVARYRAMPYAQYLQTPRWRATRNAALHRARYRCHRCTSGRELEVHHKDYTRKGAELDSDLEVLCRGCHLGLHVQEAQHGIGVYLKLAREILRAETFANLGELLEAVKCACARARIPYAGGQVHAAISRIQSDEGLSFEAAVAVPSKYRELLDAGRDNQPLTHAEACGIIARLNAQGLLKPMPTVRAMTVREADRRIALRQIAALVLDQVQRCEEAEASSV